MHTLSCTSVLRSSPHFAKRQHQHEVITPCTQAFWSRVFFFFSCQLLFLFIFYYIWQYFFFLYTNQVSSDLLTIYSETRNLGLSERINIALTLPHLRLIYAERYMPKRFITRNNLSKSGNETCTPTLAILRNVTTILFQHFPRLYIFLCCPVSYGYF